MKSFILYGLIIFLCAPLWAQRNFHKLYNLNNRSDFGNSITELRNNYVVFGISSGGGTKDKFLMIDTSGSALFHKEYQVSNDQLFGGGYGIQVIMGLGGTMIQQKRQEIVTYFLSMILWIV